MNKTDHLKGRRVDKTANKVNNKECYKVSNKPGKIISENTHTHNVHCLSDFFLFFCQHCRCQS